jgi:hypothetical protein
MKNIILLSAVLFALSQTEILVEADKTLFLDGLYLTMGGQVPFQKLVGLHLSMVPFTLACMVVVSVLVAYAMEYIEKK